VARFPAEVGATPEFAGTNLAAAGVGEEARLVFEGFLAAHACFLHQEGAFRTAFLVGMAVVGDLRMATVFGALALKSARWRDGTTG